MGQEPTRHIPRLSNHAGKRVGVLSSRGMGPSSPELGGRLRLVGFCRPQDDVWDFHDIRVEIFRQERAAYDVAAYLSVFGALV